MPKNPISTIVEESRLNPKVLAFKPRQVLLLQSSTTNATKPPTRRNMKKEENKVSLSATQKATLLGSVAQYLQRRGFSKTLKKLRSEAKIEEHTTADSLFDLEEVFLKFLEICDHGSKDTENVKVPVSTDAKSQEKKKSKKKSDSLVEEVQFSAEVLKESADNIVDELAKPKDKKNKKSKLESESLGDNIIEHKSESVVKASKEQPKGVALLDNKKLGDSEAGNKKDVKQKKEKKKLSSVAVTDKVEQHFSNDEQGVDDQKANKYIKGSRVVSSDMVNASGNHKSAKKKEKKEKRKDPIVSKNLGNGNSEEFEAGKPDQTESKQANLKNSKEHSMGKQDKGAKKRKRLTSEENAAQPDDEKSIEESKRRKTSVSEEAKLSEQSTKSEGEEAKQTNGHANEYLQENGKKFERVNSTTKLHNVEPTSVKRFQRVNVEEVVFSDERLKDNSYWAKDGAETGYGAKAQGVLGQVKGRGFRHEKTKKKRGTYRGGQIDLQSHSVKFYSDDE